MKGLSLLFQNCGNPIHRVRVMVQGQVHDVIAGLNDVQIKILRLFGAEVGRLYQISSG